MNAETPVPSSPDVVAPLPFRIGYRRWLDGLRGVAILMVLAFHLGLLPGGSLGVDVFFVLSGFLITALLVEEWQSNGTINLKHFYLRRALRLMPAMGLLLAVYLLYSLTLDSGPGADLRWAVAAAGCYIANWPSFHHIGLGPFGHTWSLSVEEQFYLVWPPLLFVLLRSGISRPGILRFVAAVIVASATWRMFLYAQHREMGPEKAANVMRLYMGSDTRADTLLVGCLAALLLAWNMLPSSQRFLRACGAAAVVSVVGLGFLSYHRCLDHSQYYHGLFTVAAAMVAAVIVRLCLGPSRLGSLLLESPPLVGIGRISYGLYLYHIPVLDWYRAAGVGQRDPARALAAVATSLALAVLSYFILERPFLHLKNRLRSHPKTVPCEIAADLRQNLNPTGASKRAA